ncbi:MAG: rod shape-determining protein MreC [Lachnospiraceae bacterium]|uniref:rod shape-determining protein MreC n=1 Tax=Falcatimonas sp. MSJ-15 TaxID=2841515 RepID=UPI001C101B01|nr:rod shape-determining protein MreC [Falcatimonas sp. MSJ-15]MBQ5735955.1 rod shape-determining protein MreC [Lachnospiraceae bacterium]MBU5470828.1 rod shape-determining protein MreC [Falcatimonas sp. MSJ-15]MEE0959172.1 rod shape-determining protein MreC [Lachnospiraceae bacterium]
MKRRSKITIPAKYYLTGLSALCVVLMLVSYATDVIDTPLNKITGYVITPVQNGVNYIGMLLSDRVDNLANLKEVMNENESLQAKVAELTEDNNMLMQEKYELDNLRELYNLDQLYPTYSKVAARVVSKDTSNYFCTFTIDKGSNDGIAVDMNVIADGGLVGIVTSVGPSYSTVMSIIDDSSNVSAMVLSTSDICYIRGDLQLMNDGLLHLEKLNKDVEVENGAKIVTSHVSSKYLQGILIGYVTEITTDSNNLTKSGYISPVVDFEHLQNVLVITELKQTQDNKE